eukprot:1045800-Amphidinium_carterae.2
MVSFQGSLVAGLPALPCKMSHETTVLKTMRLVQQAQALCDYIIRIDRNKRGRESVAKGLGPS